MTRITRIKILFGQFYPCDQCHPWSIPCWLRLAAGSYPWSSALRRPRMNQPCAASRADSSRSSRRANVRSEPRLYQGSFRSSGLSFTDVVAMESLDLLTLGGLPARAAGQSKSMAAHTHQTSARLSARLPWRKGQGKLGARLGATPQPQRRGTEQGVGVAWRVLHFGRAAAGPADTTALPARAARGNGTDWPVALDWAVEREGVSKFLTVRNLVLRSYGRSP